MTLPDNGPQIRFAGRPRPLTAVVPGAGHGNGGPYGQRRQRDFFVDGLPVGPQNAACSNIDHAHRLRGKLLLIVGELDMNVPAESTLRFAEALIKAACTALSRRTGTGDVRGVAVVAAVDCEVATAA